MMGPPSIGYRKALPCHASIRGVGVSADDETDPARLDWREKGVAVVFERM